MSVSNETVIYNTTKSQHKQRKRRTFLHREHRRLPRSDFHVLRRHRCRFRDWNTSRERWTCLYVVWWYDREQAKEGINNNNNNNNNKPAMMRLQTCTDTEGKGRAEMKESDTSTAKQT